MKWFGKTGQTDWNIKGKYKEVVMELNDTGIKQAEELIIR